MADRAGEPAPAGTARGAAVVWDGRVGEWVSWTEQSLADVGG
jgi:hypothetical protein